MLIFNRFSLSSLCFGAAQTLLLTLLPVLHEKTSLGLTTLVLGLSLGTLCFLPGTYFWNKQNNKFSVLFNSMSLAFSVLTLALLIHFSFKGSIALIIFIAGRFVWGLGASGINGLTLARELNHETKKVKAFTGNSLALNLGRLMGTTMVLLPFELNHILFGFFALTSVNVILLLNVKIEEAVKSDTTFFFQSKMISPALTIAFFITLITGLVHAGLPSFIQHSFSMKGIEAGKLTGTLLMTGTIVMMAGLLIVRKFQDNWKTFIASGTILMSAGLVLLAFKFLYLSIALICLGVSFLHPGSLLLMSSLSGDQERGKSLGLMSLTSTLGSAAGGILLSLFSDHFTNIVIGLALVLSLLSYQIFKGHDKREVLWKA